MRPRHKPRRWPGPDFLRADWLLIVLPIAAMLALGALLVHEFFTALNLWLEIKWGPHR
jgi:hypothetical protein